MCCDLGALCVAIVSLPGDTEKLLQCIATSEGLADGPFSAFFGPGETYRIQWRAGILATAIEKQILCSLGMQARSYLSSFIQLTSLSDDGQ